MTEEKLGDGETWHRVDRLLERADLPLKTAELAWLSVACGLIAGVLLAVVGLPVWLALLGFAGGRGSARRLRVAQGAQADPGVRGAAARRPHHAGRVAPRRPRPAPGDPRGRRERAEPARKEFGRVVTEASLGRPMEEALGDMAGRLESEDFDYVVTAVTVQRQVGGALAGLLDMVADTVRSRQQFHRKVRSLTAMGRMSALILIAPPVHPRGRADGREPGLHGAALHDPAGHTLIALGLAGMAIGSLFLKKIVSFKG